ncbi:MAG: hypothetical protein J6P73_03985 [Bacteroidales bacterium]|nr:hypothetical protein [Bacteroidales bacterium]
MNDQDLRKVALRYQAMYLPVEKAEIPTIYEPSVPLMAFAARLKENGYCLSEELLHALSLVPTKTLVDITTLINEVMRVNLNWMPLVKGWDVPTGETRMDHLITFLTNLFGGEQAGFKGTTLPCGHFIPEGTFPLERYNGCPYCGRPFRTANFVYHGQGSKLKELRLFTLADLKDVFNKLLTSPTPLDATQLDSLKLLLKVFDVPEDLVIPMKETMMVVIRKSGDRRQEAEVELGLRYLKTPTDILRYFWYQKTKQVRIIEPKYLVEMERKANTKYWLPKNEGDIAAQDKRKELKLKYDRRHCRMAATWLNAVPMTARQAAENMNPKRGMWVRMIHALRLGEYSRRKGFEHLAEILDVFYKQDYETWMGKLDSAQRSNNKSETLKMLCERPGLFARCLFATMLRFGKDDTLQAFETVLDKLPARLILSLGNNAELYFTPSSPRLAHPITGGTIIIQPNPLLTLYPDETLETMANDVKALYAKAMLQRFARQPNDHKTIYIDPRLYDIPVSVGDRTTTIQDTACALQGTRFPVEGDAVRVFMQWGKGMPASHIDMDLSCRIAYRDDIVEECAYFNLTAPGAKHSGDIQEVPDQVGAAEYIELTLPELEQAGARYVTFTCNAYTDGTLSPNLMVGWMNSAYPMTVSEVTGVAYDPSCVQHMVRISESNLSKGLVFGVLDVAAREIYWLEMPFTGQTVKDCNGEAIELLLKRLKEKLSVGQLLDLKREAQKLSLAETPEEADEAYTYEWALNPAEVGKLLTSSF